MAALNAALDGVDADRLVEIGRLLVDVPSPTGEERPLAEEIAASLRSAGVESHVQPIDARQANAWGRIPGRGDGPTLLLYSPIDTMTSGTAEDVPWVGPELRPDMRPQSTVAGGVLSGLGAMNPKGHAACILMAAEAIATAAVPLRGDLLVGFGAGGMPTDAPPGPAGDGHAGGRRNVGHGVGCNHLLERGVWPDAAVVAKSGWAVAWEEVGIAWCEVLVRGAHGYVGARHRLPYSNPITDAARVVEHLEAWLPTYADRHTTGQVAPQGIVGHAEAGWSRTAAFVPGAARLLVDLRLAPGRSPLDACRELAREVGSLAGIDAEVRLALAIPGTRTEPDHWVVRRTVEAWEEVAGLPHQPPRATSGATDANVLRRHGIPTARVGLPKLARDGAEVDFALGMNAVEVPALVALTELLVRVALATCDGPRDDGPRDDSPRHGGGLP